MKSEPSRNDVGGLLRRATVRLADAGIESARVDAELLLAAAAGLPRSAVTHAAVMGRDLETLGSESVQRQKNALSTFEGFLLRRCAREPLQHILGVAPFRYMELAVGPGVFVPRPETETVAEQAIAEANAVVAERGDVVVVDLCTGSGAIALAVASEVAGSRVYGVELDAGAFAWAEQNLTRLQAAACADQQLRVTLVRGDARLALTELDARCDVVVSNPPYVPPDGVPRDAEVALHDPQVALYGLGPDGLAVPRGITLAAARLLREGGLFIMEHAEVQDEAARSMVLATGAFDDVRTVADLTGRPRMVVARRTAVDLGIMGDSKA